MNLITLEEYKAYKKIGNPEKDGVLQNVVSAVSDLIKSYCGKTFIDYYYTPKTEVFTVKPGMNALIVNETPIQLVSLVNSLGTDITSLVTIDSDSGIIYHPTYYDTGYEVVTINYTGGYATCPYDVKLAAFELVDYYMQGEHTARKTFGGTTVEYQQNENSWPYHIKSILDMHRDV